MGLKSSDDCHALASKVHFPNTTVLDVSFVPAGTNLTFPNNHPTCLQSQVSTVDVCRVQLLRETGPASNVSLEAWLPMQDTWTGRFLGLGNGGLGGCIKYNDLSYGSKYGFATIGTNNGHDGNQGESFYKNPGVWEDYVYRAVHLEAETGKSLVDQAYGMPHTRSYYLGCSTGGRQGFKEAQLFPGDFDGIVAGAPAFDLLALIYSTGNGYKILGPKGSPTWLSPEQWELVYADINRQCDGLDGARDGIIEDPSLCQYRPEQLLCGDAAAAGNHVDTSNCITPAQAASIRALFADVHGTNGTFIYPRLQPGANGTAGIFNGSPPKYPVDFFRYVLYANPGWDISTLSPLDMDAARVFDRSSGLDTATFQGDLSAARDAGVKILHWHGLADDQISSENSARYYNHVARTMNAPVAELDEFYRYFRVSGTGHCRGGPGAQMVGGNLETDAGYAEGNVLASVVRWVEEGIPPEHILGKKLNAKGEVVMQRRHCKYPTRNVYKGPGPVEEADSWQCV
ncbi:tannase and feruloyl esterase [Microdochium bolleyi]|uniref:Carboxylic ester hydrolase n=1 Tax=Microdochium bolleyi TaxID=196109 RepID=A0A136IZE2_9PEZI|nr:tannase and feruloyl esterase [Microdochium bolleyi]